jgi:hypothetical protein
MTPQTPIQLAKYRTRHAINVRYVVDADWGRMYPVCMVDGLRIYRRRSGWLHDRSEIRGLVAIERGEGLQW